MRTITKEAKKWRTPVLVLLALTALTGCGDTPTTQQTLLASPARMDVVSGNAQSALAGSELPNPLMVRVVDAAGAPIADQIVNFHVTKGGGSVFAGTALTDAKGVAQERWTVGSTAGAAQALEARAVDAASGDKQVFANFLATATSATAVAAVAVTPTSATVVVGATRQLSASATTTGRSALAGVPFTWESSNTSVASVDSAGLVTARAIGSATITATAEGENGSAVITVTAPAVTVATVAVSPTSANVTVGGTRQLTATARDAVGTTMPGQIFTWASNNTGVATVSSSGLVTATVAGTATITATAGGKSASAAMTVIPPAAVADTVPPGIPGKPTFTMSAATADSFTVTASWSGATDAAKYEWNTGSNSGGFSKNGETTAPSVIYRAGLLTDANGYWFCTSAVDGADNSSTEAACNGFTAPAAPTAPAPTVATVTVSPTSANLVVGATRQLSALARDAAGTTIGGKTFTWSSSNTSVATVSSTGLVTARAAGSATIDAGVDGENATAAISVTAVAPPAVASVAVSPTSASLTVGGTRQLAAVARDASGGTVTGTTFTWSSSNTAVASVSSAGMVTARAAGSATITAGVDGKGGTAALTVTASSGGGGSSTTPNLLEDFSTYSSTADLIANSKGVFNTVEDFATNRIVLDTSVGFGSSSKSMRYDWGGGVGTIGRMIKVPNAKEIWVEWTHRFQQGYSVEWGGGGDAAYKFLHVEIDANSTNGGRFGHGFRFGNNGESNIEPPNDVYQAGFAETNFSLASVADGQWHTYRYHVKLGNPDLHEFWVDGQLRASKTGFDTRASEIWGVALGRNSNQAPKSAQSQWWGQVKLWWGTNNPGW